MDLEDVLRQDLGVVSLRNGHFLVRHKWTCRVFCSVSVVLLLLLGAGSFGQVILVKHKQTAKVYALKVMPIAHVIRLKQVDHVKQEKEVLRQLDHPFIVNL